MVKLLNPLEKKKGKSAFPESNINCKSYSTWHQLKNNNNNKINK